MRCALVGVRVETEIPRAPRLSARRRSQIVATGGSVPNRAPVLVVEHAPDPLRQLKSWIERWSASSTVRYHADTREDPDPSGKARGRIPRQYCYSLDIQDVYHGRGASGSDACPDEQAWHARECLSLSCGLAPKHSPIRPRRNSTGTRSIQSQTRCEGNPTFTLG